MVGDRAFSRLRIGAMSRRPVLVLGLPLVVGPNGTDAFIMAALDLTWVTDQMNGATVAHAFGLALTNGDGRIFAHAGLSHDEPIILGQTLLRDMKDVTILDGSAVNNIPGGMFVRPLVDANYVERVVTEQFHRSLMALATVLALGFFIFAIAVNRWVTPPIKAMRRLTDRLIAGDYGARSGISKGGTELLELAIRLDAVAGALQQREREAIDKGEHLAQALEAIDDGFAIFDPEDRLVVWNTKYEEVYASTKPALRVGATFEELIRLGVAHGQYPNAIGREEEWIKHRLALHRDPGERIEQPLPDGRWLRIKEHRTPDGSIVGLRTDITELKLREARLEEQAAQLSRYAHIASHDLQEPLRKIHTFSGILRRALDNGRTDDVDRAIEVMSKAAENGRTLVTDLLRYSKMKDQALERDEFNLSKLVKEVVEQCTGYETGDSVAKILVSLPDIQVVGDRALVRQIIQNLVQNALKYRKPNTVASLNIEAAITRDGGVSLSVTDQGIGFDEGLKDQIFQPFKRLVSKAEFEGSGIGLALVKSITDRHGWAIDCSSQPGMGATFTLNIPAGAIVSDAQSAA